MGAKTMNMYDNEDLTISSNQVVDLFLQTMYKEGHIDEKKLEEMTQYRVVLHKKGFFGRLFNSLFSKEECKDRSYYSIVKVIPMNEIKQ